MRTLLAVLVILAFPVTLLADLTATEGLGIDLSSAGAGTDFTIAFDPTELLGSRTWGDASTDTIVWTWNRTTGTDPTITFNSGSIGLQALSLTTDLAVTEGGTGASSLADLIALTTHTTGNYVASVADGFAIDGGSAGSEGAGLTIAFDPTEITGGTTWDDGGEASVIWSWNLTAGDPAITFGNGIVNVSTGALQVGGVAVLTASPFGATIDDTEMTTEDFGDFSNAGGEDGFSLDADVVGDSEVDYANVTLTDFDYQTAWRVFYSDANGDVSELALGGAGTYLQSNGAAVAPSWATPGGGGDMTKAVYDVLDDGFVDGNNTAYGASWNGNPDAPSMDAAYDKMATFLTTVDISSNTNLAGDTEIVLTGDALSIAAAITRDTEVPGLETNGAVDSEAELEAILGIGFGASKVVTAGYILVADGTDFESVPMSGDVTIVTGGATAVADESHAHTTTTISGLDISDDTNLGTAMAAIDLLTASGDGVDANTATPANGDTKHLSTGDQIYDFVIALGYLASTAIDTFAELDAIVADKVLVNTTDGATWTGVHDFGGATSLEVPNTAGDVTVDAAGEVAVDSTQKQLAVYDGNEVVIPLRHIMFAPLYLTAAYDVATDYGLFYLDTTVFPDGIVITEWTLSSTVADPTTELNANLLYCDDITTGALPGANPVLIDVLDSTTGNSSETNMASSDLGSGTIPADKYIYIDMDADPTDTTSFWILKIEFLIPES